MVSMSSRRGLAWGPWRPLPVGSWHICVAAPLQLVATVWSRWQVVTKRPARAKSLPDLNVGGGGRSSLDGRNPSCPQHLRRITPGHKGRKLIGASKERKERVREVLCRQSGPGQVEEKHHWGDSRSKAPWFNQKTFFKHLLCAEPCDRYYGGYKLEEDLDTSPKGPALS
jgi:hypothetical protein